MVPPDPDEAQPALRMWGETVQVGALLGQRPCGGNMQCMFSARVRVWGESGCEGGFHHVEGARFYSKCKRRQWGSSMTYVLFTRATLLTSALG